MPEIPAPEPTKHRRRILPRVRKAAKTALAAAGLAASLHDGVTPPAFAQVKPPEIAHPKQVKLPPIIPYSSGEIEQYTQPGFTSNLNYTHPEQLPSPQMADAVTAMKRTFPFLAYMQAPVASTVLVDYKNPKQPEVMAFASVLWSNGNTAHPDKTYLMGISEAKGMQKPFTTAVMASYHKVDDTHYQVTYPYKDDKGKQKTGVLMDMQSDAFHPETRIIIYSPRNQYVVMALKSDTSAVSDNSVEELLTGEDKPKAMHPKG